MYANQPSNVTRCPQHRPCRLVPAAGKAFTWLCGRLLHCFLPRCCLACQAPVWADDCGLGLCPDCVACLSPWPDDGCIVCQGYPGRQLGPNGDDRGGDGFRCGACRLEPPPYDLCLAAWSYEPPLDAVLQALKFRHLQYLAEPLGRLAVLPMTDRLEHIDVVVPVPLHWHRRWARGFDQAEILGRAVAKTLRRPCRRALRRRRSTLAQSLLSKTERRRNLTGAFTLHDPEVCHRRHVLLVDDVLTTGATFESAAKILQEARPASLSVLAIARTPATDEP